MQLASIMGVVVAILVLLAGVTVIFGSKSNSRVLSVLFFVATMGAFLWTCGIIVFMNLPEDAMSIAPSIVTVVYLPAIVMTLAILGYIVCFTGFGVGRIILAIFSVIGLALFVTIIASPHLLYNGIILNEESGNAVGIKLGWFYTTYTLFFVLASLSNYAFLLAKIFKKPSVSEKNVCILLLVGLGISGLASLFFDVLLPTARYDLIWVGPLSISVVILTFYYAILRYRMMVIDAWWMKVMSYVVLIATMALIYVVVFFVASILLFGHSSVSVENIVLNFIMVALVFLMMPFLAEMMTNVRSLLSINSLDIGYIAKRLNRVGSTDAELKDLASFLADHLHFSYVGILIGGKLYGSKVVEFTMKEIEIESIKSKNTPGQIWRGLNGEGEGDEKFEHEDMRVIVDLRDGSGQPFGRIIFGAPYREGQLNEEDFVRLEMVINLIGIAIDPDKQKNLK